MMEVDNCPAPETCMDSAEVSSASADCTTTTTEPPSAAETTNTSESSTSTNAPTVSAGTETVAPTDVASSNLRNSTVAEAAKPRESSSVSGETVRQQPANSSAEPLPPGYVEYICSNDILVHKEDFACEHGDFINFSLLDSVGS